MTTAETNQRDSVIDSVADWLMTHALTGTRSVPELLQGCCDRLRAGGVPVWRANLSYRTLHPQFQGLSITWAHPDKLEVTKFPHSDTVPESFRQGPHYHRLQTLIPYLRRHLTGPEELLDYSVLTELRDAGGTDYLAYITAFDAEGTDGVIGSWATDRPDGFTNQHISALMRIQRRLGVACKVTIREQTAHNVVSAYLGPKSAEKILAGQIKPGDGEAIRTALWYSDLRDSTEMAERMPPENFLADLNTYFACSAGAVIKHGGQVLTLIGDALLAIFPVGDVFATDAEACGAALAAGIEAEAAIGAVNAERSEPLRFGIGLHLGDVIYGNIGTTERLQFTVVGRAVNQVARLESLTKELSQPILASTNFMENASAQWRRLGDFQLRGIGMETTVYAPYQPDGAASE